MAYDEGLAQRVRETLSERDDLSERKMFGGLCYMLGGNMCAGIVGDELMLRVGPEAYADALARPHARAYGLHGEIPQGNGLRGRGRVRGRLRFVGLARSGDELRGQLATQITGSGTYTAQSDSPGPGTRPGNWTTAHSGQMPC